MRGGKESKHSGVGNNGQYVISQPRYLAAKLKEIAWDNPGQSIRFMNILC